MLISVPELHRIYGVRAHGVLHVGAHEAEELDAYSAYDWTPVVWVEMLPDKFAALEARFADDGQNTVLQAACWDVDGVELPIFRADNGQSSSLLPPDHHLRAHPSISFVEDGRTRTARLDSILPHSARFDFINFDIQGAELRALRGLGRRLSQVRWVYLEVNQRELYRGCATLDEIDAFMAERGFVRIATRMLAAHGWGDALYVNAGKLSKPAMLWPRIKARLWNACDGAYRGARAIASRVKSFVRSRRRHQG